MSANNETRERAKEAGKFVEVTLYLSAEEVIDLALLDDKNKLCISQGIYAPTAADKLAATVVKSIKDAQAVHAQQN